MISPGERLYDFHEVVGATYHIDRIEVAILYIVQLKDLLRIAIDGERLTSDQPRVELDCVLRVQFLGIVTPD